MKFSGKFCGEVFGEVFGAGRYVSYLRQAANVVAQDLRKPAAQLTQQDAYSYACSRAWWGAFMAHSITDMAAAVGFPKTKDFMDLLINEDCMISR